MTFWVWDARDPLGKANQIVRNIRLNIRRVGKSWNADLILVYREWMIKPGTDECKSELKTKKETKWKIGAENAHYKNV